MHHPTRHPMRRTALRATTLTAALAAVWMTLGATAAAAAPPGITALERFFSEVTTFKSTFTQAVLDENLVAIDESSGSVWLHRPGRFRWDYRWPEDQEIVGDGERVWIYDKELEQVIVRDQNVLLGRTPAILLAGEGELKETYEIRELGRQGRLHWVALLPRDTDSSFTEVRIAFGGTDLQVLELIDALEQRTQISFLSPEENLSLDEELFRFTPPPGVDVINQDDQ